MVLTETDGEEAPRMEDRDQMVRDRHRPDLGAHKARRLARKPTGFPLK